jgi:hypothetical protein
MLLLYPGELYRLLGASSFNVLGTTGRRPDLVPDIMNFFFNVLGTTGRRPDLVPENSTPPPTFSEALSSRTSPRVHHLPETNLYTRSISSDYENKR